MLNDYNVVHVYDKWQLYTISWQAPYIIGLVIEREDQDIQLTHEKFITISRSLPNNHNTVFSDVHYYSHDVQSLQIYINHFFIPTWGYNN